MGVAEAAVSAISNPISAQFTSLAKSTSIFKSTAAKPPARKFWGNFT